MILRCWLTALLVTASALSHGDDSYNYTFINSGFGYNNHNQGTNTIDGTTWFVNGAFKIPSLPVILNGGYSYGHVNKEELAQTVDMNSNTYFAGASLLLTPAERFHVIPSVTTGLLRNNGHGVGADDVKDKTIAYTASVNARYHLEKGLWLNTGYIQQYYDRDESDHSGFFTAGAEYQVDKDWGIGLNYRGNSDQYTTDFFVKLFF